MRLLLASLLVVACTDRSVESETDTETGTSTTSGDADPTDPSPDPTTGASDSEALDNPSGPCRPVDGDGPCPQDYICCSDDPATAGGRLPNYFEQQNNATFGPPLFSAANNALSYSGHCVDVSGLPSPFASGCPVACNPTWTVDQRDLVCGAGATCCPFTQLDPAKDCVLDPQTNRWRAVRGTDIGTLSTWGALHTTNQDPSGQSCEKIATVGDAVDAAILADCYAQLTVADQRGFCYATCPCQEDLCDQKNPGYVPRCG